MPNAYHDLVTRGGNAMQHKVAVTWGLLFGCKLPILSKYFDPTLKQSAVIAHIQPDDWLDSNLIG